MALNTNPNPNSNFNLPEEIIYIILSRLPVKSLLKFRSVCKLWLSIISCPQFIKSHLENTEHHKLIATFLYPHHNIKTCSLHSLINEPVSDVTEPDYPLKSGRESVWIVGCCNGLVCLVVEESHMFLWNPATRKSRVVHSETEPRLYRNYHMYRFGYDECNDDFKVVEINMYEPEARVYSSKSECWGMIGNFPFCYSVDNYGMFTNGVLHWLATRDISFDSWESCFILSLDIEKDTYGEFLQPKYGKGEYKLTLGILTGYLSIFCHYEKSWGDIWIMKEYGVSKSWTKLVAIPYFDGLSSYRYFTPLHIYVNGDILLLRKESVQLYNYKDKKFRNLDYQF